MSTIPDSVKAAVYDRIVAHLNGAQKDPRVRERARGRLALENIGKWTLEEQENQNEQARKAAVDHR